MTRQFWLLFLPVWLGLSLITCASWWLTGWIVRTVRAYRVDREWSQEMDRQAECNRRMLDSVIKITERRS